MRVWDLADGRLRHAWPAPNGGKLRAVTPDGRIGVADHNEMMQVWDLPVPKRLGRLAVRKWKSIRPVAISADGTTVAFADLPNADRVRVWEVATGRDRVFAGPENEVAALLFPGDSRRFVSWSESGDTCCWDVASGKLLWRSTFTLPPQASGDGRLIVGTSQRGLHVLDAVTGKPAPGLQAPARYAPNSTEAVSLDGRLIVLNVERQGCVIWDSRDGRAVHTLPFNKRPTSAFAPDGRSLVTANRVVQQWDVSADKMLRGGRAEDGPADVILGLQWSPDGRFLSAQSGWSNALYLWDTRTGQLRFYQPAGAGHARYQWVSRDRGRWLTPESLGPQRAEVRLTARDWGSGTLASVAATVVRFEASGIFGGLEFGPMHQLRLAVRGAHYDDRMPTIELRDLDRATGRLSTRMTVQLPTSYPPALSPDGRFLFGGGRVVDVERLTELPPLQPFDGRKPAWTLSLDAAGFLMATSLERRADPATGQPVGGVGDVAVYERLTGNPVTSLPLGFPPYALSPDGHTVVSIGTDRVQAWDVHTGKATWHRPVVLPAAQGITSCGSALAFSPDGQRLAVGLYDGTVMIWEVPRRPEPKAVLTQADLDRLWSDMLSPDARVAWAAVFLLSDAPAQAVPFLTKRVSPVAAVPRDVGAKLVADLNSPAFRVREAAARRVLDLGDTVRPALDTALQAKPNAELQQRLDAAVESLSWKHPPRGDDLRRLRALAVLERIGTPAARARIEEMTTGLPAARVTLEAKDVQRRLLERHRAGGGQKE